MYGDILKLYEVKDTSTISYTSLGSSSSNLYSGYAIKITGLPDWVINKINSHHLNGKRVLLRVYQNSNKIAFLSEEVNVVNMDEKTVKTFIYMFTSSSKPQGGVESWNWELICLN